MMEKINCREQESKAYRAELLALLLQLVFPLALAARQQTVLCKQIRHALHPRQLEQADCGDDQHECSFFYSLKNRYIQKRYNRNCLSSMSVLSFWKNFIVNRVAGICAPAKGRVALNSKLASTGYLCV
jgi:hypothetical protein